MLEEIYTLQSEDSLTSAWPQDRRTWRVQTQNPEIGRRLGRWQSLTLTIWGVNCYLREGITPSEAFVRPVEGAAVGGW